MSISNDIGGSRSAVIGAAYIRVSTDEQAELSPDAQLREIEQAARADGVFIPKEYIFMEERGRSGRRADNRPEFQRMIATAKLKPAPFQYLYLWKFSRFARNQDESTFYKGILRKKCGVTIKSVSEPIMEGMFGRLVELIIEWSDEFYSVNLSGEVLRGMTEKAMRKGYQSTPCLGYDAVGEGRPFVINEQQYAVAAFIHQSYAQGKDLTAIARDANLRGYRSRRGNCFSNRAVRSILVNPFYNGLVSWNGLTFEGSHETRPVITDVFTGNQERLARESQVAGRRDVSAGRHWLSGLLVCGSCGATLSYSRTGSRKYRSDCFQCWRYAKGLHADSCSISVKKAEHAVLLSLKTLIAHHKMMFVPGQSVVPDAADGLGEWQALNAGLDKMEQRIRKAYEYGVDSLAEYEANRKRIQAERAELLVRKPNTSAQNNAVGDKEKPQMVSICDMIADPDVCPEVKGTALRQIIRRIVIDRKENRIRIYYSL